jgi:hypothetical protein
MEILGYADYGYYKALEQITKDSNLSDVFCKEIAKKI